MNELKVTTSDSLKFKLRNEIEILPCREAAENILEHPKCPFRRFAFVGEGEIERKWYYIAGNGLIRSPSTQIISLEK